MRVIIGIPHGPMESAYSAFQILNRYIPASKVLYFITLLNGTESRVLRIWNEGVVSVVSSLKPFQKFALYPVPQHST